jgi:hypothetical protein
MHPTSCAEQASHRYETRGQVSLQDFNILASRFGQSIAAESFSASSIMATPGKRALDVLIDDVVA